MLLEYAKLPEKEKAGWEAVTAYVQLVPALLDSLKSITGKIFASARGWAEWWQSESKKFEVMDK